MSANGTCLYCGKSFVRKHPSQKFCGKRKTGRQLCKDRYHNRERARAGDITPARAAYTGRPDTGSWEAYARTVHPFCDEALQS